MKLINYTEKNGLVKSIQNISFRIGSKQSGVEETCYYVFEYKRYIRNEHAVFFQK